MADRTQSETPSATDRLAREIGKRIFQARNSMGWSQQVLSNRTKMADAEKIGISRAVLSLYETGTNKPGAREIRLLCDTVKVSPNWLLYGSESPAQAIQASSEFLQGSEIHISTRLAFAMLALDPTDRDSLAQLVFSMLTKKIGDVQLSSLMVMAGLYSENLMEKILDVVGQENKKLPLNEIIEIFTQKIIEGVYTNYGNLRSPVVDTDTEPFNPDIPPPPRELK